MLRLALGLLVLVVSGLTHALAGVVFLVGTCAVSDVADRVPARVSTQGRLCDASDHWLNAVPWVVLAGSCLLAVVLAVALWSAGAWRWVGLTACLWLPVLTSVVLAVPGDSCTPDQREALPAHACDTEADT